MANCSLVASDFVCIADKCKHSCCLGWEIDVDDETYELYKEVPGEFGDRLRENIADEGDCRHFILGKGERCPFLNDNNLCDIILNLGEDYLCDICSEHPRFYVEKDGDYECGVGMCCEEAARMIITNESPCDEQIVDMMKHYSSLPLIGVREDVLDLVDFAEGLERLGDEWGCYLESLRKNVDKVLESHDSALYDTKPYRNILEYIMFRYDSQKFAEFAMHLIILLSDAIRIDNGGKFDNNDLVELCRVYSSEIEYSEENVDAIHNEAWKNRMEPFE